MKSNGFKLPGLVLLGLIHLFASTALLAEDKPSKSRGYKADRSESCVRDTSYMRRNHMELILHQRDLTVHDGIRNNDDSLAGCVDCHTSRDDAGKAIAVNTDGQFCYNCHEYSAVHLDCFQCHATVPEPDIGNNFK